MTLTERRVATVEQVSKAQRVRVLDVLLIGPLMIGDGLAWRNERPALGLALATLG